jgi:hypothetical protein
MVSAAIAGRPSAKGLRDDRQVYIVWRSMTGSAKGPLSVWLVPHGGSFRSSAGKQKVTRVWQPVPLKSGLSAMQRFERIEMKQTQGDVGRTKDLDDEIAHCDREIASLKRNPEKNGINHDVMLAEWQKNRQVFVDEKKKAAKLIAE